MAASVYTSTGFDVSIQSQINDLQAAMPQPSTLSPIGVADSSAVGTNSSKYAIEGHIHASRARKQKVTVTTSSYTWVYPTSFSVGIDPICNAIAQCPTGTTDLINVQMDGPPNNTQCTFKITRYTQGVVGVVSGVLSVNPTPITIVLNMLALEP